MKLTVIGPGRWGSCIAWYLNRIGHEVILYGRKTSKAMQAYLNGRKGEYIEMPEEIELSTDIGYALRAAELVLISVPSQSLRGLLEEIKQFSLPRTKIVLCMKGIEISTKKRLSEVTKEVLGNSAEIAVWLGPGHVQEFYKGIPNCMVIDSDNDFLKHELVDAFSGELIRFYYGHDLIGNEVGAAAKNVIGIAAGILDGLNLTTLKGALMSRGTHEIARLIKAMGGKEMSAYGLCHLGDYEATVFSPFSHNRSFGEAFVKGAEFDHLAEGYYTVKALVELGGQYGVELPICSAVYSVLYAGEDASKAVSKLFTRTIKNEF